jgi:hypothetical protein
MNTGTFNSMPGESIGMRLSGHAVADRQLTHPTGSRPKEVQSTPGVRLAALVFGSLLHSH